MRLHFKGKYNGDENSLPQREHPENYVPYREPSSMKKLAVIANGIAIVIAVLLLVPFFIISLPYMEDGSFFWLMMGSIGSLLVLFPHEILHACCFREDVEMYSNLKQGLMFVVGTEDMSRGRFIFMSMLPNLVFGVIPYLLFLIHPQWVGLGMFGAVCLSEGAGDYMNVFNTLVQVPRGAKVYMSGMHSYWYVQREEK